MGRDNQWLKPVLAKGVAMLLLLRLKNSPADDVIKPTLEAWYRVITHKKAWDMDLDKVRFETAFMTLGQTCDWFPTPKQLLEVLPKREYPELRPPPPKTEEELAAEQAQKERNVQRLKDILRGKI
ncbi:hypothetical protein MUU45_001692 [Rodentibacter pneumotropicus]|uniref:Uncharacterized protein n=1 Tax=Rodentibacter pneumotropicus TaxID=758 RepID=A0AAW5LCN1_9PAST|nr:hypothetical protein [Rodentibacter pneumotropicus]MCQ9121205.1 hypothetical protein [Rodentibacter pneumotropicus]